MATCGSWRAAPVDPHIANARAWWARAFARVRAYDLADKFALIADVNSARADCFRAAGCAESRHAHARDLAAARPQAAWRARNLRHSRRFRAAVLQGHRGKRHPAALHAQP